LFAIVLALFSQPTYVEPYRPSCRSYRSPTSSLPATPNKRSMASGLVILGIFGGLLGLWCLLSIIEDRRVPTRPAATYTAPALTAAPAAEERVLDAAPAAIPAAAPVGEVLEATPMSIALEPLASEALPLLYTDTPLPTTGIVSATPPFAIGSSRDEVIAAQGTPPTYVTERALWWGSSKVTFAPDGRASSLG
jgi:hypothetical protein